MEIVSLEPDSEWIPAARKLSPTTPGPGRLLKGDVKSLWHDLRGVPLRVFLAVRGDIALGLASVSPDGRIAEWILAPEAAGTTAADALLKAVESHARSMASMELLLLRHPSEPPSTDDLISRGFRTVAAPCTTLRVLDIPGLLQRIMDSDAVQPPPDPCRIHLRLDPDRHSGTTAHRDLLLVSDGRRWSLVTGLMEGCDARIEASGQALTEYLFGSPDNDRWLAKVRITPAAAIPRLLAGLMTLRVQETWFTPLGDRR